MYLPRDQIAQLYTDLVKKTHSLSPPVLILTALTVDALCATRILAALLKRDYIPHKVQPISGYADLQRVGQELVIPLTRQHGGDGGAVVCLGAGGLVDLEEILGLDGASQNGQEPIDMSNHGVEVWVLDARRSWNLQNVFGSGVRHGEEASGNGRPGVDQGKVLPTYQSGRGGIIVWDDGDIDADLGGEREAFIALQDMPEITEDDLVNEGSGSDDENEPDSSQGRKRKADRREIDDEEASDGDGDERPRQRRRSNSSTPIPSSPPRDPRPEKITGSTPPPSSQQDPASTSIVPSSPPKPPSQRQMRRTLLKLRRKHEATLDAYYNLGTSFSEPVSSIVYSLASELGREDNDMLWLAIVGITSVDMSPYAEAPRSTSVSAGRRLMDRVEQRREILRDEVRRINPIPESELKRSSSQSDIIPTTARSSNDTGIRLSPEPRFLLIRHWSLYESMLYSPYLATRLHIWSETGVKRLNKLLAKMGISQTEARKGYVHLDMDIKRSLRQRILRFAEQYNLDGLVPGGDGHNGKEGWGFVRSWGWRATLSATDVSMITAAILEVGTDAHLFPNITYDGGRGRADSSYNSRMRALPTPPHSSDDGQGENDTAAVSPDWTTTRFFAAYDALNPNAVTSSTQGLSVLLDHVTIAKHLSMAIHRTGTALIRKKLIRHLRAFRMAVVKEGPDVETFTHPGALVRLAAWISEAVAVIEAEKGKKRRGDEALVLGCLDDVRGAYTVVGLGAGSSGGQRPKSKAEIKEKEEKRKRKEAAKMAKKAERARKKEERKQIRREILAANGEDTDDEEDASESDASESETDSDSDSGESDDESDEIAEAKRRRGYGLNRFGQAFQEVVELTGARVRVDSFEHSVVEVKKEDLGGFLERLSQMSVVG